MSSVGWWEGDLESVERYTREALAIAQADGRADLESLALTELAAAHVARLELTRAEELLEEASALADSSTSLSAAAWVARIRGSLLLRRGRLDEAVVAFRTAHDLFDEIGAVPDAARARQLEGVATWRSGDLDRGRSSSSATPSAT